MIIPIKLLKNFLIRFFLDIKSLEIRMIASDFIFDCVNLLHYKCHKINFKRGSSYIDFSDYIKKKKSNNKPKKWR